MIYFIVKKTMTLTTMTLMMLLVLHSTLAIAPKEVVILILSQGDRYHRQLSLELRENIFSQVPSISDNYKIKVEILQELITHPGYWPMLEALPQLGLLPDVLNENTNWIILCTDITRLVLAPLISRLSKENHTQSFYLGFSLYDNDPTIIHHFAYFDNPKWFPYPLLQAGVIFTPALFKRIALAAMAGGTATQPTGTDFTIDAAYELARFIFDNLRDEGVGGHGHVYENKHGETLQHALPGRGNEIKLNNVQGITLREAPYICALHGSKARKGEDCIMYPKPRDATACLTHTKREHIYFAIKTCRKYHKERILVIEATWVPFAVHRRYFSDVADNHIPTNSTGVPNVETGHCVKTLAILKLALMDIDHMIARNMEIRWIVLCDDDTLISVAGICEILGCFDPSDTVYLGERYGYRLNAADGFNYITGGGGVVLSLSAARLLVQHCTCPSATAPDDMILGACMHALQVEAIHSSRFHQARPNDYPSTLLRIETPISFHKFWQLDPVSVYRKWFAAADLQLTQSELLRKQRRDKIKLSLNRNQNTFRTETSHQWWTPGAPYSQSLSSPLHIAVQCSAQKHGDL